MGFSMATLSHGASTNRMKKSIARCCRPSACFSGNHRAPDAARCVHGGNATIISHGSSSRGNTSPWMCRSGCFPDVGRRSHDTASCPRRTNASVTMPLSSHATNIFTALSTFALSGIRTGRKSAPGTRKCMRPSRQSLASTQHTPRP